MSSVENVEDENEGVLLDGRFVVGCGGEREPLAVRVRIEGSAWSIPPAPTWTMISVPDARRLAVTSAIRCVARILTQLAPYDGIDGTRGSSHVA